MKSPLCAVGGCLFAFGGKDEDNQPFSSVYRFVEKTNTWREAGYMNTARYSATVAIFQHKDEDLVDVFVVGGYLGENSEMKLGCRITDKCEVSVTKN
jgi:N-acetylneuraminic acid mutarotase